MVLTPADVLDPGVPVETDLLRQRTGGVVIVGGCDVVVGSALEAVKYFVQPFI
jgi:hypothetical protein